MPWLETSDAGSIVIISSVSGREVDFAVGPYGAFKAALIHYAQGLAFQLAGKGIRANTVSPGNTCFPGGVRERIERDNRDLFARSLALNPTGRMAHRADGPAGGGSPRGGFPRQPGGELHHRYQPGR